MEIPNPVPVEELDKNIPKNAGKDETVEKANRGDQNGTVEQIGNAIQNVSQLEPQINLVKNLRDKVTKSIIGISRNEDVPLVENSNLKINTDDIDTVANVRTANANGIVPGNIDS